VEFRSELDDAAEDGLAGAGVLADEAVRSGVTTALIPRTGISCSGPRGMTRRDCRASKIYQHNSVLNDERITCGSV
jgi:hypothetical protein